VPALASASTGPYAETRVRGLDLGNRYSVGAFGSVTLGAHQGYALAYDETASDFLLAARGGTKHFSEGKQALVDMAKRDKRTGITPDDMQAYKDLNAQLPDPFPSNAVRGPEAHVTGGPHSQLPHGHVGPVNHIPITEPPTPMP